MAPPDDLDTILRFVWDELTRAATDGASQFRHAQVATIGAQGWPQSRTVILRHADEAAREVGFHTDCRSAKAGEIAAQSQVAVTAYDRPQGIQIRLWGQADLHNADDRAREAWTALYAPLRAPYRTNFPPGSPVEVAGTADPTDAARSPEDPDKGFTNFAFVPVRTVRLEYLHLRPTGHRRARFDWGSGWQGRWLAP
ncbi:MAG: pyridoxamine 5'-phosphate oxidase family protein [Paracoccaceae bacterium]|nr:pyridoxamine 5'-phosphate oxidase family protein [Paracoccaceae bacterium]